MSTTRSPAAGRPVGRPQDPAIGAAILRATQDLLVDRGVSGMTVDAVAAAAGTGKAAVYRRWKGKTELIVAAVRDLYTPPEIPDEGSLRADLLACTHHYTRKDQRALRVLASVLSELGTDEQLARAAYEAVGKPPATMLNAVLERWIDAGEIPSDAPLDVISSIAPSMAFTNMVLRGHPLEPKAAEEIVDGVLLPALRRPHQEPDPRP